MRARLLALFSGFLLTASLAASAAGGALLGKTLLPIPAGDDYARRAVVQADGKMIVAGAARFGTMQFALTRFNVDGSLDASFGSGGTVRYPFTGMARADGWAIALQPDGRIVVAGDVGTPSRFGVARFNTDGSVDPSFSGGSVTTPIGPGDAGARAILIQSDGKIVVGGLSRVSSGKNVRTLARYNANGTLDASFANGGVMIGGEAVGSEEIHALGLQSSGKLVVAGPGSAGYIAMGRYNQDGTIDLTWGAASNSNVLGGHDLVVQPDDKVAIVGTMPEGAISDFAILRMTADGNLDSSFGPGNACPSAPCPAIAAMSVGDSANGWGIVRQADGKLVVSGNTFLQGHGGAVAIGRFNADGSIDTTFGTNGRNTFFRTGETGLGLAMRADGRFIVAGNASTPTIFGTTSVEPNLDTLAVAFTANGALDTSFNGSGFSQLSLGMLASSGEASALQPDGKLVVAGVVTAERRGLGAPVNGGILARFAADGSLDPSFGSGGYTTFAWPAFAVALQGDGRIVAAGYKLTNQGGSMTPSATFGRFLADGSPDTFFGTGGSVTFTPNSSDEEIMGVAIQPDGRIVGAGFQFQGLSFNSVAWRVSSTGAADATFGGSGKVVVNLSPDNDEFDAIALQPDGKIVAAGRAYLPVAPVFGSFSVVRLNADGTPDAGFGSNGQAFAHFASPASGRAVVVQPDGRIVVGGRTGASGAGDFALARFASNGSLDNSFGSGGLVTTDLGSDDGFEALALLENGKIVAAGGSAGRYAVGQYLADGTLDATFGSGGFTTVVMNPGAGLDQARAISVGGDGTLYVSGSASGLLGLAVLSGELPPKDNASVSLTSSANPVNPGQAVTFSAVVSGSAGSPTGTVAFNDGATPIAGCTAVALNGGAAVCTTSSLASGSHAITASYSGDANYNAATSGTLTQFVSSTSPGDTPRLGNLATRGLVLTGNDVLIGGFVIGGSTDKTVVVRARGPSLAPYGIANPLANPTLRLVRSSDFATVAINDDWGSAPNAGAISGSGFAPSDSLESAILVSLPPGAYTAIVSGADGGTGVGIVEIFEVDHPEVPLVNISTRGQVRTANEVMIGGFVVQGNGPRTVVVRARGPSLAAHGIADPLANPVLQLVRSSDQGTVAINDDWGSAPNAGAIASSGFAPSDGLEAAILVTLDPGAYTAIVTGASGGTGVGIVELFVVP